MQELTFYFKREMLLFFSPTGLEWNTLLTFVFEPEYYSHAAVLPLPGVDRVPGHE